MSGVAPQGQGTMGQGGIDDGEEELGRSVVADANMDPINRVKLCLYREVQNGGSCGMQRLG